MLVFLPFLLSSTAYSVKQSLSIVLKYVYGIKYRFYLSIFFPKLADVKGKKIMNLTEIVGYCPKPYV